MHCSICYIHCSLWWFYVFYLRILLWEGAHSQSLSIFYGQGRWQLLPRHLVGGWGGDKGPAGNDAWRRGDALWIVMTYCRSLCTKRHGLCKGEVWLREETCVWLFHVRLLLDELHKTIRVSGLNICVERSTLHSFLQRLSFWWLMSSVICVIWFDYLYFDLCISTVLVTLTPCGTVKTAIAALAFYIQGCARCWQRMMGTLCLQTLCSMCGAWSTGILLEMLLWNIPQLGLGSVLCCVRCKTSKCMPVVQQRSKNSCIIFPFTIHPVQFQTSISCWGLGTETSPPHGAPRFPLPPRLRATAAAGIANSAGGSGARGGLRGVARPGGRGFEEKMGPALCTEKLDLNLKKLILNWKIENFLKDDWMWRGFSENCHGNLPVDDYGWSGP